ncbi:MAG: tetratricopeptide repeat protein [Ruminococcus sp.]|nr:tetratricopeptide repeat protein [Ruminococcus sp.]
MYEKELATIQKQLTEIVKASAKNPTEAVEKLLNLKEEAGRILTTESGEFYSVAATIHEVIADLNFRTKKPAEAEKSYKEMMEFSRKLFAMDKTKYDYRMGLSSYKLAAFYRAALQCNVLGPKPKTLTDLQKKVFATAETLYRQAVSCVYEHAKKGSILHVELHSTVMNELAVMYASVGNYERAVEIGKNGIQLDKAVYEKHDDKAHCKKLAGRMNALAAIYTFMKNPLLASETLEDANFVLEEHEAEDPVTLGVMLARNYLNLGGCYHMIEEEKENAAQTFETGLNKIIEINKKVNGKLVNDEILSQMVVGDYYKKAGNEEKAKGHYLAALAKAKVTFEKTKDAKYENIIKKLNTLI